MDTSAYFYVSQIYRKQNRTRKESRSVQCGQAVSVKLVGFVSGTTDLCTLCVNNAIRMHSTVDLNCHSRAVNVVVVVSLTTGGVLLVPLEKT